MILIADKRREPCIRAARRYPCGTLDFWLAADDDLEDDDDLGDGDDFSSPPWDW